MNKVYRIILYGQFGIEIVSALIPIGIIDSADATEKIVKHAKESLFRDSRRFAQLVLASCTINHLGFVLTYKEEREKKRKSCIESRIVADERGLKKEDSLRGKAWKKLTRITKRNEISFFFLPREPKFQLQCGTRNILIASFQI